MEPCPSRPNLIRPVVVGTAEWGGREAMYGLELPVDTSLILSIHDYEPKTFVYQGATWIDPPFTTGVKWGGYWDLMAAIEKVRAISLFAKEHQLPVLAQADTATAIDAWLGHGAAPWDIYDFTGPLPLSRTPSGFHASFKMSESTAADTLGELCINMGVRRSTIQIDSVALLVYDNPMASLKRKISDLQRIYLRKNQLVCHGARPTSNWLYGLRGEKLLRLSWRGSEGDWIADVSGAPRNRVLLLAGHPSPFMLE